MNPKYRTLSVSVPAEFYNELYDSYVEYKKKHNIEDDILSFSKYCVIMLRKSVILTLPI